MRRIIIGAASVFLASATLALGVGERPDTEPEPPADSMDASLYLEVNQTDGEAEIILSISGPSSVRRLRVDDPKGKKIFNTAVLGDARDLGLAEVMIESAKPSLEQVKATFPEGVYEFAVKTTDGRTLTRTAELSHEVLPAPSFFPSKGEIVDASAPVNLGWTIVPGAKGYVVTVEPDGEDDEEGETPKGGPDGEDDAKGRVAELKLEVTVPPKTTSLPIPPGLLRRGTQYEVNVGVIAENGNITVADGTFITAP